MTEYAFILTGQRPASDGRGVTTFTFDGTYNAAPGMTRRGAFADILTAAKRQYGIEENVTVATVFFSLEPNRLGGA